MMMTLPGCEMSALRSEVQPVHLTYSCFVYACAPGCRTHIARPESVYSNAVGIQSQTVVVLGTNTLVSPPADGTS